MSHDTQATTSPRKLHVDGPLLVILVTVFLNVMGFGLILPILPFYATRYGASGAEVGLLFTLFAGLQFLASPVFGALSDRYGRRPIILLGIVGQIVGYIVLGFATSLSIVFLARFINGITAGNISATQAYVADITPPQARTRAYGYVGAAFGTGFLFGPVLGGVLSTVDSSGPAFGAAVLLALNLIFGFVLLRESLPLERRAHKPLAGQINPFGVLVPLVRRRPLRGPLMATFLMNVALTGFQANFAVYANQRFNLGPARVAELLAASGLANIVVQAILVPRLSKWMPDTMLVVTGAALNAAGSLGTGFTPVASGFWGSVPAISGGYSLARGPLTSMVTKLVEPWEQGMANGGVQATISFAGIIGPFWAGGFYESVGRSAPYWTAAVMAGLAAIAIVMRRATAQPVPAAGLAQAEPAAALVQTEPLSGPVSGPMQPEPAIATEALAYQRPVELSNGNAANPQEEVRTMDDQALTGAGAGAAQPDMGQEQASRSRAATSDQDMEFEQIDLLIQYFGDQYVAHLRSLTDALERFHAKRLVGRDEQIALLTRQLAAQDVHVEDLLRQLDTADSERAELVTRLQAAERSELEYSQSLRVLDDQVRRLIEAREVGHRIVANEEHVS